MKDLMSWSEKVAKEEEAMKVLVLSRTRCFCWMVKDDHANVLLYLSLYMDSP